LQRIYQILGAESRVLDLASLNLADVNGGKYGSAKGSFASAVERVTEAEGLVMVVPEYNGSFPGILKLFIDYWRYPDSFEHRPIAMVGLGNRWGGLRPVEHLQQVFGYRNAYVFPNRIFLHNIKDVLKDSEVADPLLSDLLKVQSREFIKFIRALQHQELDANSKRKK
jgi:NAD(P)H-dependent FMN reductase